MVSGNDICHLVLPFYEAVRLHAFTPVIVLGLLVLAWCVVVLVGVLANLEVCPQWCCQRACCLKHFNYTSKSMAWGKLCALFVGLLRLMVPGTWNLCNTCWLYSLCNFQYRQTRWKYMLGSLWMLNVYEHVFFYLMFANTTTSMINTDLFSMLLISRHCVQSHAGVGVHRGEWPDVHGRRFTGGMPRQSHVARGLGVQCLVRRTKKGLFLPRPNKARPMSSVLTVHCSLFH